jgi:cytochrome c-type biogenesis protein
MTLLVLAFVTGALTALAPCVLPLLPVIIGGSATGANEVRSRARAYVIAISLATSLFLFTILLKATTALAGVSPRVLTYASGGIVVVLGLAMAFPGMWDRIVATTVRKRGSQRQSVAGPAFHWRRTWPGVLEL